LSLKFQPVDPPTGGLLSDWSWVFAHATHNYLLLIKRLMGKGEFEYVDVEGVTASCEAWGCEWTGVGTVTIETGSDCLSESPLVEECRNHHLTTGEKGEHFNFRLRKKNREIGFATVCSCSVAGMITEILSRETR